MVTFGETTSGSNEEKTGRRVPWFVMCEETIIDQQVTNEKKYKEVTFMFLTALQTKC